VCCRSGVVLMMIRAKKEKETQKGSTRVSWCAAATKVSVMGKFTLLRKRRAPRRARSASPPKDTKKGFMSVIVLWGSPLGPVCSVWAPCGALPSGGLPPFGVPPPVLTDSLRARRAALRTAHAQRSGVLASPHVFESALQLLSKRCG